MSEDKNIHSNFIKSIINEDIKNNKYLGRMNTRFPPEPNGYLHIGHAKSICLNFGLAKEYNGLTNLRFDDTNPVKEDTEYVESIKEDVKWLGFEWADRERYASDYFDTLYYLAEQLIYKGKAYVCELSPEEIRQYRGTLTEAGKNSPYRDRPVAESLDLFRRMKKGEFKDGTKVLRAKIDMASPNIVMRDPILYRIIGIENPDEPDVKKRFTAHHHQTANKWCIYPMYDFTHCISDSIEGITHSLCTLEFENNRPLYDWVLIELGMYRPQQTEFARLNLSYTVLSKRKLLQLVKENYVSAWDDPRMPTISAFRRRGYTPESIRNFADIIGVAKADSTVDYGLLEFCLRDHLNKIAQRIMAVLNPIKLVITNLPDAYEEEVSAVNNPEDESMGHRNIIFTKEIYIEQDDFMENPQSKFYRLSPGNEVRLRYAYIIKCESIIKDEDGNIVEIHCTYDPDTRSGSGTSNKKVKSTIHWVSAKYAINSTVRLYEHLFTKSNPDQVEEGQTFLDNLNPNSLQIIENCKVEPFIKNFKPSDKFQFERIGYFCLDSKDSNDNNIVFNRTATLKDTWSKVKDK
ncbi:MAG TPA: glutamine--tRNA ligase/YqeY domain fusion protein [Candidatus Kapabacteria bacterium]|nr:glutamine--tRNA ligase/YqeY domain fusion protein [Candidatus Kapabacteria bacterium]